jgi:translation initiation factor IF-3
MVLKIGKGDLEIKLRNIREFLADGDKVKIQVFFRGREMAHQELGFKMMSEIEEMLDEVAVVESKPQLAGRNISIVVRAK